MDATNANDIGISQDAHEADFVSSSFLAQFDGFFSLTFFVSF